MWNIRNSECSAGRPAVIYDAPELFGGYESGRPVAINDLSLAKKFSLQPSLFGCTTNFLNFVSLIMHEITYKCQNLYQMHSSCTK